MYGIFLDGESKTGKTTVCLAIEQALTGKYKVYTAAAGSFYRRVTLAALEKQGEYPVGDTTWLASRLQEVLASDIAYDETHDWSRIHDAQVDELVSVAGQFDFMQAAGRDWWHKTADLALKQQVDVLLVDGRNPRKKLAQWRADHLSAMPIALDLCVYCSPEEAGVRYARAHTDGEPTPEQIASARDKIVERRHLDRTRKASPYAEPDNQLLFEPLESDANQAVVTSFDTAAEEPPRVIRYDTTNSPIEVTLQQAGALARSAIDYLNQR